MKIISAKKLSLMATFIIGTTVIQSEKAHAYDMDCKVILCIAGGFPAGCSDAYSYMIKRITNKPKPKPPFGFCAMSDGSEYKAHNVNYQFLRGGPNSYDCPAGKKLFFSRNEDEYLDRDGETRTRFGREIAFCYTHSTSRHQGGRDGGAVTTYHGKSNAQPVNFQLSITIEPGTGHEFRSPVFRINYGTGYISQSNI